MDKVGFFSLAAAPFFLLPTFAAFANRKANKFVFLGLNVLMVGALALGVAPGVILWLVLLHFSLRKDAPKDSELDEPVTLAPYDDAWPAAFAAERRRLCETLSVTPDALEHIGSTAVPGLLAKPVVDMMLGLPRYPPPDEFISRLTILGYQDMREANVPGRRYLRLREGQAFNLHIVERGGAHWTGNLRFRDYLRSDAGARERYAAAKRSALEKGDRLLAYSAAKQAALEELLAASKHQQGV
jgi:GrpB-like predicted nucleotidyltransferase (UPF0157 family)